MKINYLRTALLASLIMIALPLSAINENRKFGNPTKEEMTMTVYDADKEAPAVVLYELSNLHYVYSSGLGGLRTILDVKGRIKVLKDEGVDFANFEIPYHSPEGQSAPEKVIKINATAFNMEGEKTVKTKMKDDLVFRERLDRSTMLVKFSVPQVRVGTVFEYEFTIESDSPVNIRDWAVQRGIPVSLAHYTMTTPNIYDFDIEMQGSHPMPMTTENAKIRIADGADVADLEATKRDFEVKELPALKGDDFVICSDDYASKVVTDLNSIRNNYGIVVQNFNATWEDIDKLLCDESDFGGCYSMTNPLKSEQAALTLDQYNGDAKKIAGELRNLLRSKVNWNGQYGILSEKKGSRVVKDATGSAADINFVMMSMLRDAGVKALPVVLRRRSSGRLPLTHASVGSLNTMILAVANGSEYFFMDASDDYGAVGVINPNMLTTRGRIIEFNGSIHQGRWADLSATSTYKETRRVMLDVKPDGEIKGSSFTRYQEQGARSIRVMHKNAKDSADYVQKIGADNSVSITDFTSTGLSEYSDTYTEDFKFESKTDADDVMYIDPFVFFDHKSLFTDEKRDLPVEFPFLYNTRYIGTINLPEGYEVAECPSSVNISNANKTMATRIAVQQTDKTVNISVTQQRNTMISLPQDYQDTKEYYRLVDEKCQQMIVLKKK